METAKIKIGSVELTEEEIALLESDIWKSISTFRMLGVWENENKESSKYLRSLINIRVLIEKSRSGEI